MLNILNFFILIIVCKVTLLCSQQLHINNGVDTSDMKVKQAITFYQNYLDDFHNDTLPDFTKYWEKNDYLNYKFPDQIIYAISGDYPTYSLCGKKTIIYVKKESRYITIKTLFAWVEDSTSNISPLCITNHYISFDNNEKPFFVNPLVIKTQSWQTKKIRNVDYYFPTYHKFNSIKSKTLIKQIENLEKEWDLKQIGIKYYFANTFEELQKIRGFDYNLLMGNADKPSGISNDKDNIIYCAGLGENYFHEIVHIYLNKLNPNFPLKEGIAVLYGGSFGKDLSWHIKRVNSYLKEHKDIDLNNLNDFTYLDNFTNPNSVIQGLICNAIYKKEGVVGLRRLVGYSSLDKIFETEFNVTKGNWNLFLRNLLNNFETEN